jgi:hypothetical protein
MHEHHHLGRLPKISETLWYIALNRQEPDFIDNAPPDHGRIESRNIWTTTELNSWFNFPHVGQAFVIERHSIDKKSGKCS